VAFGIGALWNIARCPVLIGMPALVAGIHVFSFVKAVLILRDASVRNAPHQDEAEKKKHRRVGCSPVF
jgi:hypothetical protein